MHVTQVGLIVKRSILDFALKISSRQRQRHHSRFNLYQTTTAISVPEFDGFKGLWAEA